MSAKELKFRQQTDEHDYAFKKRFAIGFLTEEHQVKLAVHCRPNDPNAVDSARKLLLRLAKDLVLQGELVDEIQLQDNNLQALIHPRSPFTYS